MSNATRIVILVLLVGILQLVVMELSSQSGGVLNTIRKAL